MEKFSWRVDIPEKGIEIFYQNLIENVMLFKKDFGERETQKIRDMVTDYDMVGAEPQKTTRKGMKPMKRRETLTILHKREDNKRAVSLKMARAIKTTSSTSTI